MQHAAVHVLLSAGYVGVVQSVVATVPVTSAATVVLVTLVVGFLS